MQNTKTSDGMNEDWIDAVLEFWYSELTPKDWFNSSETLDRSIADRFGGMLKKLQTALPDSTRNDPRAALAAVIVLDQFSRNIHRKSSLAFANDAKAAAVAKSAIDSRLHLELNRDQQYFLYMPFMHSESLADQELGLRLFKKLGNKEALKYAIEHHDIVKEYGRFPHRNKVMSRTSTAAELTFLKDARSYGQ